MAAQVSPIPSLPSAFPPPSAPTIDLQVVRRNGSLSPFDPAKISVAITKAFVAVEGTGAAASHRIRDAVDALTAQILATLLRRAP